MEKTAQNIERKTMKQLVPTAPPAAIDLLQNFFRYEPDERLTAQEVLFHPFLRGHCDPVSDSALAGGSAIAYYDFEFEAYVVEREILRDLILDEVILTNSREARAFNSEMREQYPRGVLETKYERATREEAKMGSRAKKLKGVEEEKQGDAPMEIDEATDKSQLWPQGPGAASRQAGEAPFSFQSSIIKPSQV